MEVLGGSGEGRNFGLIFRRFFYKNGKHAKSQNIDFYCHAQCFVRVGGVQKSTKNRVGTGFASPTVQNSIRDRSRTLPGRLKNLTGSIFRHFGVPAGAKGSKSELILKGRLALLGDKILSEFAECVKKRSGIVLGSFLNKFCHPIEVASAI